MAAALCVFIGGALLDDRFLRLRLLVGEEGASRLASSRVAVFGLGGVGSFVVEALARAGVGSLLLIDSDVVDISNVNRQIHAVTANIGRKKTMCMRERVLSINPAARVDVWEDFYLPEKAEEFFGAAGQLDYMVDAIDTVTAKLDLAQRAEERGIPLVTSLGTAGKLEPARFEVADIYETSVDPIARVMRKKLKERGVKRLKVVYSREKAKVFPREKGARPVLGSISFVPPVAGLILAGEVVRDLLGLGSGRP